MFGLGLWRHRHRRKGHHHELASLGARRLDKLGLVRRELTAAGRLGTRGYSLGACGYSRGRRNTLQVLPGVEERKK